MRTTLTSAVIATVLLGAVEPAAQDHGRAPATVKEVMTGMTVPASDAIFDAAADPPASPDDWAAVRNSAVTLAESGRLLMTDAIAKDQTTWMEMARALVREAEAVRRVADTRNRNALGEASDRVYVTCKTCHDRYMTAP